MSIRDDLNKIAAAMREVGYYKKVATPEEIEAIAARAEAAEADARRWRKLAPLFRGVSVYKNGTAHFMLPGGAIKPRARTVEEAVDAMAIDAELAKEAK